MLISDRSSDVCSSDLPGGHRRAQAAMTATVDPVPVIRTRGLGKVYSPGTQAEVVALKGADLRIGRGDFVAIMGPSGSGKSTLMRSEEHTSELQSLMRISYAVFCLKKKKNRLE